VSFARMPDYQRLRDFLDTLRGPRDATASLARFTPTPPKPTFTSIAPSPPISGTMSKISSAGISALRYRSLRRCGPAIRKNEIKNGDEDWVDALYSDPRATTLLLKGMTGHSLPSAMAIAQKFPWAKYQILRRYWHSPRIAFPCRSAWRIRIWWERVSTCLRCVPFFRRIRRVFSPSGSRQVSCGRFSSRTHCQPLMYLVLGMILHDWNLEVKGTLLKKAYEALPPRPRGALIVYEHLIDDERRKNVNGLLMSLLMLVETQGGFDYTGADCCKWMSEAGFCETARRTAYGRGVDGGRNQVNVSAYWMVTYWQFVPHGNPNAG